MSTVLERLPEFPNGELPVVRFERDGQSYTARLRVSDTKRFHDGFLRHSEELDNLQLDAILQCLLADLGRMSRDAAATRLARCGLELLEVSSSLVPADSPVGRPIPA